MCSYTAADQLSGPFEKPATVSESELYWFDDAPRGGVRVPASWRILYKDGADCKPVENSGAWGVEKDRYNKVSFKPVKVGIAGEKHFEVVSGLKDGDKIVAGTYQAIRELKDGALVRETKVDAKKPQGTTKS